MALSRVLTRVTVGLGGVTELHCLLLLACLLAWLAWVAWVAWVAVEGTGHWYGHHSMAVDTAIQASARSTAHTNGTAGTAVTATTAVTGSGNLPGRVSERLVPRQHVGVALAGVVDRAPAR